MSDYFGIIFSAKKKNNKKTCNFTKMPLKVFTQALLHHKESENNMNGRLIPCY